MPLSKQESRGSKGFLVQKVRGVKKLLHKDLLAVEEPLEIRLSYGPAHSRKKNNITVTMRTPGYDFELAAGFLYSEGIVRSREDIQEIDYPASSVKPQDTCNVVDVQLRPGVPFDPGLFERHFTTTSSCGVCGKATLESLRVRSCPPLPSNGTAVSGETILRLAAGLKPEQRLFKATGGLHAAGLFDSSGNLKTLYEDVGRHNAVDKVIGKQLLSGAMPLADSLLMVSGRTSFEIMQKAAMARIPIVAAVSAPSSLAVELAIEFNMTLLGFVRDGGYNIYTGAERLQRETLRA